VSSRSAAVWIYDSFAEKLTVHLIKKIFTAGTNNSFQIKGWVELPTILRSFLEKYGINSENIVSYSNFGEEMFQMIVSAVSPAIIGFIELVCASIIFMIVISLVRIISRYASRLFKIPVLAQVNGFFGAVFGVCKGACVVWLIVAMIRLFTEFFGMPSSLILKNILESSVIFKLLYNFDPIGLGQLFSGAKSSVYEILPLGGSKRKNSLSFNLKNFKL
jgi:hypothetical protein